VKLAGARCLVVGGARHLGRALSLDLAGHNVSLAVSSRHHDADMDAALVALRAAGAPVAAGVTGDVRAPEGARGLVSAAADALGGLDALLFTASGPFAPHPPQEIEEAAWDASLDTIAKGFFFTACAAYERFAGGSGGVAPEAGVIVAITDCLGLQPWSSFAAHGAAKAAQIHLVKQLARAWTGQGVRVCGVAPGPVDLTDDPRREATLRAAARGEWERLVRPAAVGAAVRFCLETPGVTGVNVIVDNGMLLTS
jgi:NAD(P)-dependent dehydrogenase (short-subunit alcohol dehydrogenase family)